MIFCVPSTMDSGVTGWPGRPSQKRAAYPIEADWRQKGGVWPRWAGSSSCSGPGRVQYGAWNNARARPRMMAGPAPGYGHVHHAMRGGGMGGAMGGAMGGGMGGSRCGVIGPGPGQVSRYKGNDGQTLSRMGVSPDMRIMKGMPPVERISGYDSQGRVVVKSAHSGPSGGGVRALHDYAHNPFAIPPSATLRSLDEHDGSFTRLS